MTYLAYRCLTGKKGSVPTIRASVDRHSTPVRKHVAPLLRSLVSIQNARGSSSAVTRVSTECTWFLFCSHSCQYRMHVTPLPQSLVSIHNARGYSSTVTRVNTQCTWLLFCSRSCQYTMHVATLLQSFVSIKKARGSSSAVTRRMIHSRHHHRHSGSRPLPQLTGGELLDLSV